MKKKICYLLIAAVFIPVNVFAASFNLGDFRARSDDGDMFASLYAVVNEGTQLNSKPTITCKATDNVNCTVDVNDPPYSNTDAAVAIVNIKNTSDKDLANVSIILNITYEGESLKLDKEVSIKAGTKAKSTNSKLKALKTNVGKWNVQFNSDTYEYTIYDIRDSINRIIFTPTCAEGDCRVSYEGGVGSNNNSVELASGNSTTDIKVLVRSEATDSSETTTTYTLKVIKGTTTFNSSNLKSLKVGEYALDPEFSADVKNYTVKVPTKVSNIESLLSYELEDEGATVKVTGANKLDKDTNEVEITVTSRDGSMNTLYRLTVIKEDDVNEVIEVIGYKDNKVTYMNVEGIREELSEDEFKEKYPEEYAKILDGTYKFDENGNIIKEDNSNNTTETKKISFPWIIVILIVVAIIIIGVAGFFIFREPDASKKKKDTKKEDNKEETKEEITEEQQEELNDIDSYNEEARLIAEDNQRNENPLLDEDKEVISEPVFEDITEEVVREEVADDYVNEEKSATMDIDEALSDLMNTKEYNFKDK